MAPFLQVLFLKFQHVLVWYWLVFGLFSRGFAAGPYGFREPSLILTFGLLMSLLLMGFSLFPG